MSLSQTQCQRRRGAGRKHHVSVVGGRGLAARPGHRHSGAGGPALPAFGNVQVQGSAITHSLSRRTLVTSQTSACLWVPRTSSGTLTWALFFTADVTARMVRGPLISLCRLSPHAPTSPSRTVRQHRIGRRSGHAPPRSGRPPPAGGPSVAPATRSCAPRRTEQAAPAGEAPPLLRPARHLVALASGSSTSEVDVPEASRASEDPGWNDEADRAFGQGEPNLGLSADPR